MEKFDSTLLYNIGAELRALTVFDYKPENRLNLLVHCLTIQSICDDIFKKFSALKISRAPAEELNKSIGAALEWLKNVKAEDMEKADGRADYTFKNVIDRAKNFETILLAELQTLDLYKVTQKGIYSMPDLIDHAENIFPSTVLTKLNSSITNEIRESGRCLAFDNPTASAFHIIRAAEAVMHEYYLVVCKPTTQDRLENWGQYIAELHKSPDPEVKEVVAMLQQFKDRHRNLIMHPEVVLTPDESFTLFEIAQGVIIAMAGKLKVGKGKQKQPQKSKPKP